MSVTYPVAEVFHSIQGEGVWTGTPMMFVRLAGCNVGKYSEWKEPYQVEPTDTRISSIDFPLYKEKKNSICTTIDGQRFLCDTDYHKSEVRDMEELFSECYEEHMCITGGEPFLHPIEAIFREQQRADHTIKVHVETSGTLPICVPAWECDWWITCCPKEGYLDQNTGSVDEFKFLVGPNFKMPKTFLPSTKPIFLQPINGVNDIDEDNLQRCLELLKKHPNWRLSAQLHKYIKVR